MKKAVQILYCLIFVYLNKLPQANITEAYFTRKYASNLPPDRSR